MTPKTSKATGAGTPAQSPTPVAAELSAPDVAELCTFLRARAHELAARSPHASGTISRATDAIEVAIAEILANTELISGEVTRLQAAQAARAKAAVAAAKADRAAKALAHVQRTLAEAKRAKAGLAAMAAAKQIEESESK